MDGKKGPQTQKALSRSKESWLNLIDTNLVRLSKLNMVERSILINVATYQLYGLFEGHVSHQQKVVVGAAKTRTPITECSMYGMTVHPSWGVPPSIFLRSLRDKVLRDPQYLDAHNYAVFNKDGDQVDPSSISWNNLSLQHFPYRVCQSPGPHNSLGKVKFHLNNPENIQLHDTPKKELFAKSARAFSSGCVRLEAPRDLADWLGIQYDESGPAQYVEFQEPVPVIFTYITLWFDGDTLYVSNDPYRYDV